MKHRLNYSPEVREPAIRMVRECRRIDQMKLLRAPVRKNQDSHDSHGGIAVAQHFVTAELPGRSVVVQ